MAAEPSPEDATAASSPTAEDIIAPAPVALLTEAAASTTILEKGKLRISESETSEMKDAETDATAESVNEEKPEIEADTLDTSDSKAIVSSSKRSRPLYKFDPDKITLRFLFANRDGLTVTLECEPHDTVAEVKAALMSVWPEDFPNCTGGENLRLVCMGKGYLMPDTRTLEDCQVPVFKTHPTPINVSVRPDTKLVEESHKKKKDDGSSSGGGRTPTSPVNAGSQTVQGCSCSIL